MDTLIRGGTIHTRNGPEPFDVAITGERISTVAPGGSVVPGRRTRVIEAHGLDLLPGVIDVHVHLALPFCGTVSCDDFDSGSSAALAGGVTTLLDFAIPAPGQTLTQAHETWLAKATTSRVDFSWHLALTRQEHLREIHAMAHRGLPTFKAFMIYEEEGWAADDAMLFEALEAVALARGMLLVHAESPRVLRLLIERAHMPDRMRREGARLHTLTRPNFVEAEAIERVIRWSQSTGGRLYIVHMSTAEGADLVRAAQARGVPVLAETCAQYLVLDDRVFHTPDGHLFACCPQVKKPADIERLWKGLGADNLSATDREPEICIVSTDTCSFTREQKGMWWVGDERTGYGDWTRIPMGLPGLETLLPILYTHGVASGRLSMARLVELLCMNPARFMGLGAHKGSIYPGFDADMVLIDPAAERTVDWRQMHSRCDWSPYQGMRLRGFPQTVLRRGEFVVEEGRVVAPPGSGRWQPRHLG